MDESDSEGTSSDSEEAPLSSEEGYDYEAVESDFAGSSESSSSSDGTDSEGTEDESEALQRDENDQGSDSYQDEVGGHDCRTTPESSSNDPSCSYSIQLKPVTRRKRGSFKPGFLKKSKQGRPMKQPISSESADMSEDYCDDLASVISTDPASPPDDCSTALSESCASESEVVTTEDDSQPKQETKPAEGKKLHTKRPRKKQRIGRRFKWAHKKFEEKESREESVAELKEKSSQQTQDVGTFVEPADIAKTLLESSSVSDENLHILVSFVKAIVDDKWSVSCTENTLFMTTIINPANPSVERCITWSNAKPKFLVFNRELHQRNVLWSMQRPDPSNYKSVADYLLSVSNRFLFFEVCSGVTAYKSLWEKFSSSGHGVISNHLEPPCIRSSQCISLTLYPTKCSSCRSLQKKMYDHLRQKARTAARENVDKTKVNNRYLQAQEIEAKLKRIQNEKKLSKQTIARLKKRIDKLLKEKQEMIDSRLSDDFVDVMTNNKDKMTQVELLFWEQQSLALSKRGKEKTMRWHPFMIRLALHLRMLSKSAFDFMSGILCLPSERRLLDYSQFTEAQEGVQQDLLELLKNDIEKNCANGYEKYFSLMLDEMSIRSDLVYNSRTGELVGFTNLTSLEAELAALEAEISGGTYQRKLAKKILVFMLQGCVSPLLTVAAIYSTDDLSSFQLYTRAWDVIYAVEEAGAKILLLIFDGASTNRKFIRMHFNMGDKDFTYVTINCASGESRLIYFMLDPPHLLKTCRNCLANSFGHRNSRKLCNNDQCLSWRTIEDLYDIDKKLRVQMTKLTQAHVKLTSFSCMNVRLAAQVLSGTVAQALRKHKERRLRDYSDEFVKFIDLMNKSFDCLNAGEGSKKKETNQNLREYRSITDPRFTFLTDQFLKYLEDWETYCYNRPGNFTKEERARSFISYQTSEGFKITIHSCIAVTKFLLLAGAPYVSTRRFNQDPLEQYFSDLRRAGGDNNNPHLKQCLHTRLSLAAQGQTFSRSKAGNTEVLKRKIEVDSSPLQVRKKVKVSK